MDADEIKIDLFLPPSHDEELNQYSFDFYEALSKLGVNCRLLKGDSHNPAAFIDDLLKNKPHYTLSFNGLLPDDQGRFLADLLNINHIAYITEFPSAFALLNQSKKTLITAPDKGSVNFLKGLGCQSVFPLKTASSPIDQHKDKTYKYVAHVSSLTLEDYLNRLAKKFPEPLIDILLDAAELTLKNEALYFYEALVQSFRPDKLTIPPQNIDFSLLLEELENLTKIISWERLLESFPHSIDIFSEFDKEDSLKKKFHSKHRFHRQVSYNEWRKILMTSEYNLLSSPILKNGVEASFYLTIASSSMPIINENAFTKEWDVIRYHADNPSFGALTTENVEKNLARFKEKDTWTERAKELISIL